MTDVTPPMRLKVNSDTFFVPDPTGTGVYFQNNAGSFHMDGPTVQLWIDRLLPVLDGTRTLASLTEGLPDAHRHRVYDLAGALYRNHFVRDVSGDAAHELPIDILTAYAHQIEFVDHCAGSGPFRFQTYRQTQVLAVGAGSFVQCLVAALFHSGLPHVHVLVTDGLAAHQHRFEELLTHARTLDPTASLHIVRPPAVNSDVAWQPTLEPFKAVLYASETGDSPMLQVLDQVCRGTEKWLLPAQCVAQSGVVGPLLHPDSGGGWLSARRRLHGDSVRKDPRLHAFSSTAAAVLANVAVFELFKLVTGTQSSAWENRLYVLDLETLEGRWHTCLPHPLVTGWLPPVEITDVAQRLQSTPDDGQQADVLAFCEGLTSSETGIFHAWGEGDLGQLPLARCRVDVIDPLGDGPAPLLPAIVCAGLTHEAARRESALAGLEAYVGRLRAVITDGPPSSISPDSPATLARPALGIGAGATLAEGVYRGLDDWAARTWTLRNTGSTGSVHKAQLNAVEDDECRFYVQALTTHQQAPLVGIGEPLAGLPVMWVVVGGHWYAGVGLTVTLALRKALQQALLVAQTEPHPVASGSQPHWADETSQRLTIPAVASGQWVAVVRGALQTLAQHQRHVVVSDTTLDPVLKQGLAGVFCVSVQEVRAE